MDLLRWKMGLRFQDIWRCWNEMDGPFNSAVNLLVFMGL